MGSGGVIHCRCAKCFCYPTKRRIRRRPRNLTILSLPEDVLFHILKWLSVGDILAVRSVHSHLKYLVDNHASVWACASFQELWPSPRNLKLFERAAEKGNFEAAVKLGIAYLYNEGLSVSDEARAEVNGLKASRYFSLAERLNVSATPFIWLFIRPPWSVSGSCCKAVVHESLKAECQLQRTHRASILYCLGKVLSLFEDEEKKKQARDLFEESANQGCLTSSYLLWESDRLIDMSDPGRCLHNFRKLRDYAAKGCWEAQLSLAKACANGNQLGLEAKASNEIVCQLFQASHAVNKQEVFSVQKGLNDTMRYILIDWLVEVATMKDFTSLCLHLTVECVDRYLRRRLVPRYRLQLLGIACMVICTRFISKEILTIREAVWLTDNTYKYEDLVRMMGEIISALEGKIRVPTVVDYKDILLTLIPVAPRTQHLCSFLCELSLLHTSLAAYSPAHLAAAALLLARLTHGQTQPWTTRLWDLTGFSCEDLIPCVLSLHQKCFHDDVPKDYRQVSLTAVKQRFEDKRYEEISQEEVLSYSQVCAALGVKRESPEPASFLNSGDIHSFLSSPSARRTKRKRENSLQEDRGSFVTTPTAELSSQEETLLGSFLDWNLDYCSGYEGDQESEGEKEGDVTAPSGILDVTVVYLNPEQHCCQESSDEEACLEDEGYQDPHAMVTSTQTPLAPGPEPPLCSSRELGKDIMTSGYSSISGVSPTKLVDSSPPQPTSALSPGSDSNIQPCHHHARKSCLQCHPLSSPDSNVPQQQVKRKNLSTSSKEEQDTNLGFLNEANHLARSVLQTLLNQNYEDVEMLITENLIFGRNDISIPLLGMRMGHCRWGQQGRSAPLQSDFNKDEEEADRKAITDATIYSVIHTRRLRSIGGPLVAELWNALDTCAERQRELERSLQVSRRLLRTWEPTKIPAPEPTPGLETNEEAPFPACKSSPQDLKELELLTQALEKAVQVRKGISKAGKREKASSLKSGSIAASATTAPAPPQASETKPSRGIHQITMHAKGLPKPRLLSAGDQKTCMGRGIQDAKPRPSLRDQQIAPLAAPQAPEAFTLKEKGTLLQLPTAFRKAASQNSRLWAQLSSTQTSDSMDATMSSKTQFLQKMQMTSGLSSCGLSAAEVEAEVGCLQKACLLLRLRMVEELTTDPMDWMQEYRRLLTLEGLQALVGQCLYRLQELRTAVVEQQLGPRPEGRLPRASLSCGGGADSIWSPQVLLYSSTQELQTLAALRLRVGMLHQQIHLQKVLMAELLPLVSMQEPLGPAWLALYRAVHSLLCEGGQRFLTILRDEPAD